MMIKKEKPLIISLSIIILAALLYVIFTLNKFATFTTSSELGSQTGVLDLSTWDFNNDGYTELGGHFEFYWHQLLTPETIKTTTSVPSYMKIPMAWNKYNKEYDSIGYATYSLTVKVNPKYKDTLLGISVPSMLSSYKLWVNGEDFSSNGIVSTNSSSEIPENLPITNYFMNNKDNVHLVLQVSNHNFRNGGTRDNFHLGTQSQMANKREASIALEIFYFGVLLIMGLYHLWLYTFRTSDVSKLYFGALCITISLRSLMIGNKYFLTLYDNINYTLTLKLEYLTFYAAVYFMLNYIYLFLEEDMSTKIIMFCKSFCLLFIITNIFIPPLLASKFVIVFQIYTLLLCAYSIFVIFKSYLRKKRAIVVVGVGCLLTITISAVSILGYLGIINTKDYSVLGFFILILINAFILAMTQAKAYVKIEKLSKEKEQYLLVDKLREITFLLNSTLNLEEVLDKLLDSLKELVPYDSASFFMEENGRYNVMAANGFENMDDIYKISINKNDDKLFKELSETTAPLLVSNVKEDSRFKYFTSPSVIESWMGIPIIFKDKMVGILTLDSSKKAIYTKYHSDIAFSFANHAAMAIENAKLYGKIKKQSRIDPLTNLYNRRSFFELANISFDKAKLSTQTISAIMMDIDDFKQINDKLGHHTGDLVLIRLAKICLETLSSNHVLGRFGGEEFIALLPSTSLIEAEIIAETLRSAIECNPLILRKSDSITITVSLGVASITPTTQNLDYLFIEADKAMYTAKQQGKNRIVSVNSNL
ncbi:diguanylate cyclase [Clostridium sp.]|jgi:diguanylate cyclase (GGDEF)-like protein|uniref:diguanylate cyclase n=1 Tax=Clostridium sp. TaxID=1506 RepID=UPI003EEA71F9